MAKIRSAVLSTLEIAENWKLVEKDDSDIEEV